MSIIMSSQLSALHQSFLQNRSVYFTFSSATLPEGFVNVLEFEVIENLSECYEIQIKLTNEADFPYTNQPIEEGLIDTTACLKVYYDGILSRQFFGIVQSFAQKDTGSRDTFYEVVLVPTLSRLKLISDCRIFQNMSIIEITERIFSEYNIKTYNVDLRYEHVKREYVVMMNESYFDFLLRYWAEEGLVFYFDHTEELNEELRIVDDNVLFLSLDAPCSYHSAAGGLATEGNYIRQFSTARQIVPSSAVLQDYYYPTPSAPLLRQGRVSWDLSDQGTYEHFDFPGRYKTYTVGQHFSRVRVESLQSQAHTGTGVSDISELAPGYQYIMTDHPKFSETERWLLTHVRHQGTQPQSLVYTGNDGMTKYSNDFKVVPRKHPWKPPLPPKKKLEGIQSALVVGPQSEEIYCDQFNRIKVQFHWDRYGQKNEHSSCWIRVATAAAGSSFGLVTIPRVGQEVLVSFYDGDPDHPIVTGLGFNPFNMTPYRLPLHKTKTVLRTHTHKGEGYNELSMEDEKDREEIYFHAQKDMNTLVLNDEGSVIKHDKSTLVEHDMKVVVNHDQTNHIQNDMSMLVDHDQINRVKNDQHNHIDHDFFHRVKNNAHYIVEAESRVHLKAEEHHTVDQTSHQKFETKLLVKVGEEYHIKTGEKVVIDAGAEITLKVGNSFVRIDASGVYLVGPTVSINGGGTAGNGTPTEPLVPIEPIMAIGKYFMKNFHFIDKDTKEHIVSYDHFIELTGEEPNILGSSNDFGLSETSDSNQETEVKLYIYPQSKIGI